MRRSETAICTMTGKTSSDRETMQKIHREEAKHPCRTKWKAKP